MKILALRLTAFGPFTDRVLDLSAGNKGLHVIFGLNEAGKSSALRALHALLYGIPVQTTDAFLHPNDKLRLGGRLLLSDGQEIEFVRRKGSKNTLLAADSTRLDDRVLDRFLAGVRSEEFRMFWGIDHERLVRGGREILDGHGDLGESLFAAGSGVSDLRALRAKLDEDAEALFTPRGNTRVINKGLSELKDLRSAQREVTVSADEWARQDRAVREAEGRLAEISAKAEALSREGSRFERLKRVLPLLAERDEVRRRLADLGEAPLLAPDFARRRQAAETALVTAQDRLERALPKLKEQEAIVDTLGSTPPLASESEAVSDLHQRLGSHRKAISDRPGLVGKRAEQRDLAKRHLSDVRPDLDLEHAETLRIFVGRRARIQTLAAERARLDERLATASRRRKEAREQAEALAGEAAALPPGRESASLVAAIEEARRRGDAEAEIRKLAQSVTRLADQCSATVEKLQLDRSAVDQIEELRVPAAAAITRFERLALNFDNEDRAAKTERERLTKLGRELAGKIELLRRKKEVPTEDELAAARTRRDAAFRLLRMQWEDGRDVGAEARALLGDGNLIDLYLGALIAADEIADRLRSESDRVAELAQYLDEQGRLVTETAESDLSAASRKMAFQDFTAEWRDTWKSVLATPPQVHDARAWRDDFDRLIEKSRALIEARQQHDELAAWIAKQTETVRGSMMAGEPTAPSTDGLAATVAAADRLRQRIEKERGVREEHARRTRETEKAIRTADGEERDAATDADSWKVAWDQTVRGLLVDSAPLPEDVLGGIGEVERILLAVNEANVFDSRIAGIDRDAESFRADVQALAARLGEASAIRVGAEDAWVEALHSRLALTLQESEQRRQATKQHDELRAAGGKAHEAVADAQVTLAALCHEARCADDADLTAAEEGSAVRWTCQSDLARIDKDLIRSGDGASITELEAEAAAADRDAIDARLDGIGAEVLDVSKAVSEAHQVRAAAETEFRRLAGPSVASDRAEDIQATLARLGDEVLRYARFRVASTMLTRRIDDYRRENQAPLLLRAGAVFKALTLGAFDRLDADVDDDRPVLVGVRPDGARVTTLGMSEGTVDQLFLSLRLAAVEASCAAGEPMPLVVDDVLIQFDDARSAAALGVLAELAVHTQVVLFTHHGRERECAAKLGAGADVFVHENLSQFAAAVRQRPAESTPGHPPGCKAPAGLGGNAGPEIAARSEWPALGRFPDQQTISGRTGSPRIDPDEAP